MCKKSLIGFLILLFLVAITKADIAPDPGYSNFTADLIIETKDDLSDFRFFLDFSGHCKEISIKSKDTTIIPPQGGGARYNSATLLAIPKMSLQGYAEKLNYEEENKLGDLVKNKKIEGVIEVLYHSYSTYIIAQDEVLQPTYLIERKGNTLVGKEHSTVKARKSGALDFSVLGISKGLTILGNLVVLGMPLIIIILGVWLFRRRKGKLNQ